MATDMGHNKAVRLLQQNLKEEQQTLKKMQAFSKKIKPEQSGMEEEEEGEERPSQRRGRERRKAYLSLGGEEGPAIAGPFFGNL